MHIPPKLIHSFTKSLSPEAPIGTQPQEALVAEAYTNAKQHQLNYNVEVDDSNKWSVASD